MYVGFRRDAEKGHVRENGHFGRDLFFYSFIILPACTWGSKHRLSALWLMFGMRDRVIWKIGEGNIIIVYRFACSLVKSFGLRGIALIPRNWVVELTGSEALGFKGLALRGLRYSETHHAARSVGQGWDTWALGFRV